MFFIEPVLTAVVGFATIFFAYNYRRQLQLKTTDRRIDAYADLWEVMEVASPSLERLEGNIISRSERVELYKAMVTWYYRKGNGMMLTQDTREVFLAAKENLICQDEELVPASIRVTRPAHDCDCSRWRGSICMRQLSLLRAQMKADLASYVRLYYRTLSRSDEAFLMHCGVNIKRKPWKVSSGQDEDINIPQ